MMLFGMDWDRSRPARRGGLLGGHLSAIGLVGAGRLALRWWRNRRTSRSGRASAAREGERNPIHGWQ
ncbi:MAG TPA: hypothetical protein VEB59_11680 [Gemmatimonadales bacterium]|nr:hypothetical protein [Gemmatimonadales bacterium]